jgi:hypothetical protein
MRAERRTVVVAIALVVALLMPLRVAHADSEEGGSPSPIVIVGTVLANIVYFPTKLVYSVVGGVTGAVAYAVTVGDSDTAQAIWDASCRGTYVLTPEMLEGRTPIRFTGP